MKILQSAGGHVEHSADRIVSNLQLPAKPVYNKGWGKWVGGGDNVLMKFFSNLQKYLPINTSLNSKKKYTN